MKPSALHFILISHTCLIAVLLFEVSALTGLAQETGNTSNPDTDPNGLIKRSGVIPKGVAPPPSSPASPNAAQWLRNPHKAFALAKTKQKPMLLLFTAQWNTICQTLSNEVFSSKSFNRYAKEKLVICYLDYARSPLDTPDALRTLKEKFKIRGLPVLLVFNPDGHVVHQVTGYRVGRPVDYFNELKTASDAQISDIAQKRKLLKQRGYREWENNNNQNFFAQFIKRNQSSLTLKSAAGELFEIKIKQLSPADQAFAESFPIAPSPK